jgi:hypothetical protein
VVSLAGGHGVLEKSFAQEHRSAQKIVRSAQKNAWETNLLRVFRLDATCQLDRADDAQD